MLVIRFMSGATGMYICLHDIVATVHLLCYPVALNGIFNVTIKSIIFLISFYEIGQHVTSAFPHSEKIKGTLITISLNTNAHYFGLFILYLKFVAGLLL